MEPPTGNSVDTDPRMNWSSRSRTPSPPPVLIRLVSPPTPTSTSPSPSTDGTLDSDPARLAQDMITPLVALDHDSSRPQASPPSVDHSTNLPSSSSSSSSFTKRSSSPLPFSFSSIFSSTLSFARATSPSPDSEPNPKPFQAPKSTTRSYKIRSPSLGQSKRSNVGMVKQAAIGLARSLSQGIREKMAKAETVNRRKRGAFEKKQPLRKINEEEFPNVGALTEARKTKKRQVEAEKSKKEIRKGRTTNGVTRLQTPVKTRPRASLAGLSQKRNSPRSARLPSPQKVARKAKVGPRVSFTRTVPARSPRKKVIDRPRPIRRKRAEEENSVLHEEEEEWFEETSGQLRITRPRPSSRLSINSLVQRLPFLRSHAPSTSTLSRSSSLSFFPTVNRSGSVSTARSIHPSEESFRCRGDVSLTPSPEISITRSVRSRDTGGTPPRNTFYIPSESSNETSLSLSVPNSHRERDRRREASISPGDLTKFLEELVFEEESGGVRGNARWVERFDEEEGIFADADESGLQAGGGSEQIDETALATLNCSTSSHEFILSLPPLRRQSRSSAEIETPSSDAIHSTLRRPDLLGTNPLAQSDKAAESDHKEEEEEEEEAAQVLSASRKTFVRGQPIRKGSLSSLGLRSPISPSPSLSPTPSPSPTLPRSPSTPAIFDSQNESSSHSIKAGKSIFARLQARARFDSLPSLHALSIHQSHTLLRPGRVGLAIESRASFDKLPLPHTAPLPFPHSASLSSIDRLGGGPLKRPVTAPSSPSRLPLSSTLATSSSSTKLREGNRSPLRALFDSAASRLNSKSQGSVGSGGVNRSTRSESGRRRKQTMLPLEFYEDLPEQN